MSVTHKGKYTYIGGNFNIFSWGEGKNVRIGNFCSLASNINIYTGGNHRYDWVSTYPFGGLNKEIFTTVEGKEQPYSNGDVIIGNDVWIGNGVTIMSGITISSPAPNC